jgi:2-dehydro-3-deoxygluconokinase
MSSENHEAHRAGQLQEIQIVADIVTFGEIMLRLAPPGVDRLQQALPGSLQAAFAGAEANTAVSLALLGVPVDFVTALPASPLTDACLASLRSTGVGLQHIRQTSHGRLGIFFVETGANQRPTQVWYDREGSAISLAQPADFNWHSILQNARWLHLTGITPALSQSAAECTIAAARTAARMGVNVSFDPNFRSRLWRWDTSRSPQQLASETLRQLMPFVTLMFGGEDDCRLLNVPLPENNGAPPAERAVAAAKALCHTWPNVRLFASTLREQVSATHNNWSGLLFDARSDQVTQAPLRNGQVKPWEIRQIVDRVGSGDAFDAGILLGLLQSDFNPEWTVEFATAASCLAHSIVGDWNYASRSEIEALMHGSGSGKVVR